jgi:hypothetical protein
LSIITDIIFKHIGHKFSLNLTSVCNATLWIGWGESKSLHHRYPCREVQEHPLAYGFKMLSWHCSCSHRKPLLGSTRTPTCLSV